jgi:hypothetical protein
MAMFPGDRDESIRVATDGTVTDIAPIPASDPPPARNARLDKPPLIAELLLRWGEAAAPFIAHLAQSRRGNGPFGHLR